MFESAVEQKMGWSETQLNWVQHNDSTVFEPGLREETLWHVNTPI